MCTLTAALSPQSPPSSDLSRDFLNESSCESHTDLVLAMKFLELNQAKKSTNCIINFLLSLTPVGGSLARYLKHWRIISHTNLLTLSPLSLYGIRIVYHFAKKIQFVWCETSTKVYIRGCYLICFSWSSTSTDQILHNKLVLHWQIYDETCAKVRLRIGLTMIQLWLSEVHVC